MSINLKITKNVSRVLAKLNHDFKNIHLFSSKKIFKSKYSFLFSVNHEARTGYKNSNKAHHTVYDLLPKHKRIYRSRDFLRPGYIEELIEV